MNYDKDYTNEFTVDDLGRISFDVNKKSKIIMDAKDKEYKKQHKKELIKELRNGVNDMDKLFTGKIKKKKKNKDVDDQYIYEEGLIYAKSELAKLICTLNNVDYHKYISYSDLFGLEIRDLKLKKIRKNSYWFDNPWDSPEDTRSKFRFLTYLLIYVSDHLSELVDASYKANKDGKFIEYSVKIDYLANITENCIMLLANMLSFNDYSENLMMLEELLSLMHKKKLKKDVDKIQTIRIQSNALVNHSRGIFSSKAVIVDTLVKLSYLVATNEYDVKNKFIYYENYNYKNTELSEEIVCKLGKEIVKASKHNDFSPMFKIFLASSPVVNSKWPNNYNNSLLMGMLALKYYGFITNNKYIFTKNKT